MNFHRSVEDYRPGSMLAGMVEAANNNAHPIRSSGRMVVKYGSEEASVQFPDFKEFTWFLSMVGQAREEWGCGRYVFCFVPRYNDPGGRDPSGLRAGEYWRKKIDRLVEVDPDWWVSKAVDLATMSSHRETTDIEIILD